MGRRKEALKCIDKALNASPRDPVILYNKAVDHSALGEHDKALDCCNKALRKAPEDPDILNRKALELYHLGKPKKALEYHNKALKIRPNDPVILYNKAVDLSALDRHKESLNCCNKALKQEPDDPEILNRKAFELHHLGKFTEAKKYYNKALKIRPRDPGFLHNKAVDLSALGMHKEALECCNRALESKPGDSKILNSMAVSLLELGRYDEALECCNNVLKKDPKNHWTRDFKATVSFKMGNVRRSIKQIVEDGEVIILPDTNIWLAYYKYNGKNRPHDTDKKAQIDDAIDEGKIKIMEVVECEFYAKIGLLISGLVIGRLERSSGSVNRLIKNWESSIDDFRKLSNQIGIRHGSLENRAIVLGRVNKMFTDIWKDKSQEAVSKKEKWARKNSGIDNKTWVELSKKKKDEHIAKGPPLYRNDLSILVTAASLADKYRGKKIVIFTNDRDFTLFYKWILIKLGVEVADVSKIKF